MGTSLPIIEIPKQRRELVPKDHPPLLVGPLVHPEVLDSPGEVADLFPLLRAVNPRGQRLLIREHFSDEPGQFVDLFLLVRPPEPSDESTRRSS